VRPAQWVGETLTRGGWNHSESVAGMVRYMHYVLIVVLFHIANYMVEMRENTGKWCEVPRCEAFMMHREGSININFLLKRLSVSFVPSQYSLRYSRRHTTRTREAVRAQTITEP